MGGKRVVWSVNPLEMEKSVLKK